jgi:O-antigen/teichoic acid export membrane protein
MATSPKFPDSPLDAAHVDGASRSAAEDVYSQRRSAVPAGDQPDPIEGARGRSSLAFNSVLNLVGLVAPLLAAVGAIPLLNRFLGTERVGFLTLAWALIGYFSLFDLGIGRALTKLVAERFSANDKETLPELIWTALCVMLGLGIFAGIVMASAAHWLVSSALRIPSELHGESVLAVRLLAVTLPLVVTTAGLRGILEAQGRFLVSNAVRAPMGIWLVMAPLLLIPFGSRSLAWVAGLLLAGRLIGWSAFAVACLRGMPSLRRRFSVDPTAIPLLLRFGGWTTVSNVISPLMVYMDRFLLGNRASLAAVAWYATPFEVVTKVLIIPSAIMAVLFPLFSSLASQRREAAVEIYQRGIRYISLLVFLPTLAISLFAREALTMWLGADFAGHAYRVAQLLAFGCLLNSIASVPFGLIQGAGRPDITARIHMAELPAYVFLVFWLTGAFGITGTAVAWVIRVAIDLIALEVFAHRAMRGVPTLRARTIAIASLAVVLFAFSLFEAPFTARVFVFGAVVVGEVIFVWTYLLDQDGLGGVKSRLVSAVLPARRDG